MFFICRHIVLYSFCEIQWMLLKISLYTSEKYIAAVLGFANRDGSHQSDIIPPGKY